MSKHTHHQSKAEQIDNKAHGATPFHYDTDHVTKQAGDMQTRDAVKDSSIQLRAYQIYQEKGGSDLENWLEAEQILTCNCH